MSDFQPLLGILVVEWTTNRPASFCGKLLAALGADVVKVEIPGRGDNLRTMGPFPNDVPDAEASAAFLYANTCKRSVTLEVSTEDGTDLFRRLVEIADVLVTDKALAELDRLGLAAHRSAAFASVIVTSITPYGHSGPHHSHRTYPIHAGHIGGAAYLQPSGHLYEDNPQLPPVSWGGNSAEHSAGLQGAVGTLAAVLARERDGFGQHVDLSIQEAGIHTVRSDVDLWGVDGTVKMRASCGPGQAAVKGTMPCKDGYITLWPLESGMLSALLNWLGHPEWEGEDPHWVREQVKQQLLDHTMEDIYVGLQGVGVAVSPVYDTRQVWESRQLRSRNFFSNVTHAGGSTLPYPKLPFGNRQDQREIRPAPRLGEHNEEIFCGLLGVERRELVQMRRLGII